MWNQGYAPRMVECEGFDSPSIYESPGGTSYQLACPSVGIVYVPPLAQAALLELLFPDDWSILPPG